MLKQESIIHEQAGTIREYVNNPRKHYALAQNSTYLLQLSSGMNVIDDTENAIEAFAAQDFGDSTQALYLAVYGLLQAIYVQQDAIEDICASLEIAENWKKYPRLVEIREIRNESVGHPTKRGSEKDKKKRPTSHHFISQRTLNPTGFQLVSVLSDGTQQSKYVNIPNLISDQRKGISSILAVVIDRLGQEEQAHREQFQMEKLATIFPPTLDYFFEKVNEAILGYKPPSLGLGSLDSIKDAVAQFREAVGRRDKSYFESLEDDYELMQHAITHIEGFLQTLEKSEVLEMERATTRIFANFLHEQVGNLRKQAGQIDEDNEEKPPGA